MGSKVYVKLPKAGLGNMMLTWSRAYVFAQLNNLELSTSSWTQLHWGAMLRGEIKKRFYLGYFKEDSLSKKVRFLYYNLTMKKIAEPPVKILPGTDNNMLYIFNKIFTDYDFFKETRPYKEMVKKGILSMMKSGVVKQYQRYEKPVIGLHIRRGDFKKGSTITPTSFFIEVINSVRKNNGTLLPVTIFTDAHSQEIEEILKLENVKMAESKPDILDILLLSESKIAVLSIGSTFSYWAAFLTEGIIIKNEREWHMPFRIDPAANEFIWKKGLEVFL